jgi:hypothetical protein
MLTIRKLTRFELSTLFLDATTRAGDEEIEALSRALATVAFVIAALTGTEAIAAGVGSRWERLLRGRWRRLR